MMRFRRDDSGVAMLTAIMGTMVVIALALVAVGVSDRMNSSSRVDRKRVFSFHAAEAGLDRAYSVLQTTANPGLPCGDTPLTGTVDAEAGDGQYSVRFDYYSAWPPTGSPIACPLSATPKGVLITSKGTTTDQIGRGRRIQVAAELAPVGGGSVFQKAVFSNSTLEFDNSMTVTASAPGANNGNVYTNGDYVCDNSGQTYGNIYAQGKVVLSNSCNAQVDVWAGDQVEVVNNTQIGRDAKSSRRYIALGNSARIFRNAIAAQKICPPTPSAQCNPSITPNSASVGGSTVQDSPQAAPPLESLPQLPYVESAWTDAGYVIKSYTSCATALTDLKDLAPSWTSPTVMRITGCRLIFGNTTQVRMRNHVAIISDDGIEFQNLTRFERASDAVAVPKLHMIVPWNAPDCPTNQTTDYRGSIVMANNTTIETPIITFIYSKCTVRAANNSAMYGQIYGSTVRVVNSVNLAYRPVGPIPGEVSTRSDTSRRSPTSAKCPRNSGGTSTHSGMSTAEQSSVVSSFRA